MLTKTKQPQNVLGNYHKSFCGLYLRMTIFLFPVRLISTLLVTFIQTASSKQSKECEFHFK